MEGGGGGGKGARNVTRVLTCFYKHLESKKNAH